ncbi:MAG: hypothetical protein JL50_15065 [Peptococcaceae bacterium BICA1-7]|nr:MAG: hypothetical protein JL50_15065 [Peptococcaceae bacterium BICA1-7]
MQKFINHHSGILITSDKAYLIESRLSRLVMETGARSFYGLYRILENNNPIIRQKVIDAITTHETHWFRDRTPWLILEEVLLPSYIDQIRKGLRKEVNIWSAACSSGQEPYSIAMCIHSYLENMNIDDVALGNFKITATDISEAVLETARSGCYDGISVERGLGPGYLEKYFHKSGPSWIIKDRIKDCVKFKQLNLADSLSTTGQFDVVFCRYVMIYFSDKAKKILMKKVSSSLFPGGVMFLGNSELLSSDEGSFKQLTYKNQTYYCVRS